MARIRLYLEDGRIKEFEVKRACDDHGRVILGQEWPEDHHPEFNTLKTRTVRTCVK